MLIDSHAHIDFAAYHDDREAVIQRCHDKGMRVINVGAQFNTSTFAVELAQKHEFLYATIGLHPIHVYDDLPAPRLGLYFVYAILCEDDSIYIGQTKDIKQRWDQHREGKGAEHTKKHKATELIHYEEFDSREAAVKRENKLKTGFGRKWLKREWKAGRTRQAGHFDVDKYQVLIDNNIRIVAIGECGFDYFYIKEGNKSFEEVKAKQKEVFIQHIELAKKNNLPLMLHGRNGKDSQSAYQDILEVLKEQDCHEGMIHCYGGNMEEAKAFLEQGFHIGFTGIVTFKKKAEELQEIAKMVPMDRLIIETDAPYLSPEPHRGERNEPINVEFVARKIAELKNISYDEVVQQTGQNSINLFNLA